jgi:hypothetical protein
MNTREETPLIAPVLAPPPSRYKMILIMGLLGSYYIFQYFMVRIWSTSNVLGTLISLLLVFGTLYLIPAILIRTIDTGQADYRPDTKDTIKLSQIFILICALTAQIILAIYTSNYNHYHSYDNARLQLNAPITQLEPNADFYSYTNYSSSQKYWMMANNNYSQAINYYYVYPLMSSDVSDNHVYAWYTSVSTNNKPVFDTVPNYGKTFGGENLDFFYIAITQLREEKPSLIFEDNLPLLFQSDLRDDIADASEQINSWWPFYLLCCSMMAVGLGLLYFFLVRYHRQYLRIFEQRLADSQNLLSSVGITSSFTTSGG